MASKIILGSGLIGRIAKDILPDYRMIPFGRSQFYGWDYPLAEDYISVHDSADEYVRRYKPDIDIILRTKEYKRPFSVAGQLIYSANIPNLTSVPYLTKVYGDASDLKQKLVSNTIFQVYEEITCNMIYKKLDESLKLSILNDLNEFGKLEEIDYKNHIIKTSKTTFEYESIISTIPLDLLLYYMKENVDLKYRSIFAYLIQTNTLDFEGADQVFVVEDDIDFYSVTEVGFNMFLFKSFIELNEPFLKMVLQKFNIINKVKIDKYIPVNNIDIKPIEAHNINLVGSLARWDDFYDVGASIHHLMKLKH